MSQSTKDNVFIYNVLEKNIPLVVLNSEIEDPSVVNILSDDYRGAYNAATYLIQQGHKNIAIIEGKKGFRSTQERKDGFLDALIEHNIILNKDYLVPGKYDLESGYMAMENLLNLPQIPTAVFCSNDDMAVGAMKAIVKRGLRIPEDISMIGFDNSLFSAYLSPALTTVKRPIEEISREGAKNLLDMIKGNNVEKKTKYMNTELLIRESVKNINQ